MRKKCFWFAKKLAFSAHTRLSDKEKTFFSAQRHRLRTTPKLTSSHTFHPRQLTVSLQYNNPFSKNLSLASAVQLPFRTDSKPFRRRFVGKTGFGTCRRNFLQSYFRQSFESSPESRGSQTSGVLFGYFLHDAKSDTSFSLAGSSEVLQTSEQRTAASLPPQFDLFLLIYCELSQKTIDIENI